MSVIRDELEMSDVIGPILERLAAQPAIGAFETTVGAAVRSRQRGWQWSVVPMLMRVARIGLVASVLVGGVIVGTHLPVWDRGAGSGLSAPIQSSCGALHQEPGCVTISWGTGYGVPNGTAEGLRDALLRVLPNLGAPYAGPRDEALSSDWPLPLIIDVDSASGPPLTWRSSSGQGGDVTRLAIDVTALAHGTGPAFVLLDYSSISGLDADDVPAYAIPDQLGHALLEILGIPREDVP
jgi:hypothetical protein